MIVDLVAVALAVWIWANSLPEGYGNAVARGKEHWIAAYRETRDLRAANGHSRFEVHSPETESEIVCQRLVRTDRERLGPFREP